jgi:hypothetical protein
MMWNMKEYIKDIHGFEESHITILMDGQHMEPTAITSWRLTANSFLIQGRRAVFIHYPGHGVNFDDDGDEKDGFDETLVPVDYASAGQIRDDDLFTTLIGPMGAGVTMTCLFDCCHSGT